MIKSVLFLLFVASSQAKSAPSIDWRVVGGSEATNGQFPFIISLRTIFNSHTCGGSLIANDWVVTAAHCVVGGSASSYSVIAGITQLNSNGGIRSPISQIIVHPDYDSNLILNDIALLRLSNPISETSLISIIPLETQNNDEPRDCTLIGWGRTSYPGSIPNDLQFLPSRTVSFETCRNAWPTETIVTSEICTFTRQGQGACHGDSGGPLVSQSNGQLRLIGLVSWGAPCAVGAPDVYTRVSSFIDWIRQNTGLNLE